MRPARFRLALELIQPEQWSRFETLASAYLVSEFPNLRTVAGTNDRGRDAEVFDPTGEQTELLQYSLAADWSSKITKTAKKLREPSGFPNARLLIYVTNQKIGANADQLKSKLRSEYGLILDIHDLTWFTDRLASDPSRLAAAEAFAEDIVDPFLAAEGGIDTKSPSLSDREAHAACVYLGLQWSDDTRSKGLTKLCFEALVKTALRDTHADKRKKRSEVQQQVAQIVAHTDRERVLTLADAALDRLSGKALKHWKKDDEFCLSQGEINRIREGLEDLELADRELDDALAWEVAVTAEALELPIPTMLRDLGQSVKTAIELVLFDQGEAFAAAVSHNKPLAPPAELGKAISRSMQANGVSPKNEHGKAAVLIEAVIRSVLLQPPDAIQQHFRALADTYTLFAFLRETPDVQSAVKKMFSLGEIWLDTSVILPLFAETLVEEPSKRRYTTMFRTAHELGLKLYLTPGVVEELLSHMRRVVKCVRTSEAWVGHVPFLLSAYTFAGFPPAGAPGWLEEFRGNQRPEDDLAGYLQAEHGITVQSLEDDAARASTELRGAIQEIWHDAHDRRRGGGRNAIDKNTLLRLVSHDVENYVGVVMRRRKETDSAFGYGTWWLTLDTLAFEVRQKLGEKAVDSPVMSPDFMVTYLSLGPLRGDISKENEGVLPLPTSEFSSAEVLPELLEEAKRIREEMEGQSDRIIRREVRDRLDAFRRRQGEHSRGGISAMQMELKDQLVDP